MHIPAIAYLVANYEGEEKAPPPAKTYTQAELDAAAAAARRAAEEAHRKAIEKLSKTKAEELEAAVKAAQDALKTDKELAEQQVAELKTRAETAEAQRAQILKQYETATIRGEFASAVLSTPVHNLEHLIAIFAPAVKVEHKDGTILTSMEIVVTDKDGKKTKKVVPIGEAVKHYSQDENYKHLFKIGAKPGSGGQPPVDSDNPPADTEEYFKWRRSRR
jgi:formate-dependent nitrite reductase cytochrome c552 subunit